MVRVSTITPVRNDAAGLGDAIRSIQHQRGVSVDEIVLAVAPSNDGTEQVAASLAADDGRIRIVDNPSGRTPDGLNRAIGVSSGDVVVRVDAHAVLPPDYIAHALESLDETGAGNVGAIQHPIGKTAMQRAIAAAMSSPLGTGGARYRKSNERCRVDTAWLGAFRRSALVAVGGYDPEFTRNQDAELNLRLADAGFEVWLDPRLVVDYLPRSSLSALASQYWQYGWWRAHTVRKHPGSLRVRQLVPALAVVTVAGSVAAAPLVGARLLVVPLGYAGSVAAAGLATSGPVRERVLTAAALAVMHGSWGSGFIASLAAGGR